mmetsp:Transcript_25562/g.35982  ORF Transcript_25562/g.35982 Transcript_25562/m.35982 type:complete len:88 (-) Transcript_25562:85-348(-)
MRPPVGISKTQMCLILNRVVSTLPCLQLLEQQQEAFVWDPPGGDHNQRKKLWNISLYYKVDYTPLLPLGAIFLETMCIWDVLQCKGN